MHFGPLIAQNRVHVHNVHVNPVNTPGVGHLISCVDNIHKNVWGMLIVHSCFIPCRIWSLATLSSRKTAHSRYCILNTQLVYVTIWCVVCFVQESFLLKQWDFTSKAASSLGVDTCTCMCTCTYTVALTVVTFSLNKVGNSYTCTCVCTYTVAFWQCYIVLLDYV